MDKSHSGFKEYVFEFFREDDKIRHEIQIGDTTFVALGVVTAGACERLSTLCIYHGETLVFQVSQHFLISFPHVEFPRKLHFPPRSTFRVVLEQPADMEPAPLPGNGRLIVSLHGTWERPGGIWSERSRGEVVGF